MPDACRSVASRDAQVVRLTGPARLGLAQSRAAPGALLCDADDERAGAKELCVRIPLEQALRVAGREGEYLSVLKIRLLVQIRYLA
jgi:hypothetical protein